MAETEVPFQAMALDRAQELEGIVGTMNPTRMLNHIVGVLVTLHPESLQVVRPKEMVVFIQTHF